MNPDRPVERDVLDNIREKQDIESDGFGGKLYLGRSRDGEQWVIHEMLLGKGEEMEIIFRRGLEILLRLCHPCIEQLVARDSAHGRYATLYYSHSLDKVLEEDRKGLVPQWEDSEKKEWNWWQSRCKCAFGIAAGLCYMHQKGIMHMNLKPANVMLDEQMRPKIVDFALSLDHPVDKEIGMYGTPAYMAPEMFEECRPTPACDVFAFGLIMYEIQLS